MRKAGIHNFPAIDRVVYGKAASDALKDETERLDAKRVFLIVSRTLNTKTDEIEKIRRALGVAESRPQITDPLGPGPWYGWRCPCGAHGGGGRGTIRSDAEHLAQRHVLRHPVGHPTPEIYSTEEEPA